MVMSNGYWYFEMVRTVYFPEAVGAAVGWFLTAKSLSDSSFCFCVGAPGGGAGGPGGGGFVRSLFPPNVKSTPSIGMPEENDCSSRVALASRAEKFGD